MKSLNTSHLLYLAPRIVSIVFIGFLSLFALDVFEAYSGWNVILPLVIHLIPSFVLLLVIVVAWKYDVVGAVVFLGFAVFYVAAVGLNRHWSWYAGISAPAAAVGILFLLNWMKKKR